MTEILRPGEKPRTNYRWRVLLAGGALVRAGEAPHLDAAYDAMVEVLVRQPVGVDPHGEIGVQVWRAGEWHGDEQPFAHWERHDDGTISQVVPLR